MDALYHRVKIIMKTILILTALFSMPVWAADHAEHNRIGSHGMVMFTDGQSLYSSHLPLYRSPHDYQLIYRVETQAKEQLIELLSQGMVTILPDKFDLNLLISGNTFVKNTRVFLGHFERGGKEIFTDATFGFAELIFKRKISTLPNKTKTEQFYLIKSATKNTELLIHAIQPRPSFDLIAWLKNNSCDVIKEFETATIQLDANEVEALADWSKKLTSCGTVETLYFETQDFKL